MRETGARGEDDQTETKPRPVRAKAGAYSEKTFHAVKVNHHERRRV